MNTCLPGQVVPHRFVPTGRKPHAACGPSTEDVFRGPASSQVTQTMDGRCVPPVCHRHLCVPTGPLLPPWSPSNSIVLAHGCRTSDGAPIRAACFPWQFLQQRPSLWLLSLAPVATHVVSYLALNGHCLWDSVTRNDCEDCCRHCCSFMADAVVVDAVSAPHPSTRARVGMPFCSF